MALNPQPAKPEFIATWDDEAAEDYAAMKQSNPEQARKFAMWYATNYVKPQGPQAIRQFIQHSGLATEVLPGQASPEARKGSFWGSAGREFHRNLTGSGLRAVGLGPQSADVDPDSDVAIDPGFGSQAWEMAGGITGAMADPMGVFVAGKVAKAAAPVGRALLGKAMSRPAIEKSLKPLVVDGKKPVVRNAIRSAGRGIIAGVPGGAAAGGALGAAIPATSAIAGDSVTPGDVLKSAGMGLGMGMISGGGNAKRVQIAPTLEGLMAATPTKAVPRNTNPRRALPAAGETSPPALPRKMPVTPGDFSAGAMEGQFGQSPSRLANVPTESLASFVVKNNGKPGWENAVAMATKELFERKAQTSTPRAAETGGMPEPMPRPPEGYVPGASRPLALPEGSGAIEQPPIPVAPPPRISNDALYGQVGERPTPAYEPTVPDVASLPDASMGELADAARAAAPVPPPSAPRGGATLSNAGISALRDYAARMNLAPTKALPILAQQDDGFLQGVYGLSGTDRDALRMLAGSVDDPEPNLAQWKEMFGPRPTSGEAAPAQATAADIRAAQGPHYLTEGEPGLMGGAGEEPFSASRGVPDREAFLAAEGVRPMMAEGFTDSVGGRGSRGWITYDELAQMADEHLGDQDQWDYVLDSLLADQSATALPHGAAQVPHTTQGMRGSQYIYDPLMAQRRIAEARAGVHIPETDAQYNQRMGDEGGTHYLREGEPGLMGGTPPMGLRGASREDILRDAGAMAMADDGGGLGGGRTTIPQPQQTAQVEQPITAQHKTDPAASGAMADTPSTQAPDPEWAAQQEMARAFHAAPDRPLDDLYTPEGQATHGDPLYNVAGSDYAGFFRQIQASQKDLSALRAGEWHLVNQRGGQRVIPQAVTRAQAEDLTATLGIDHDVLKGINPDQLRVGVAKHYAEVKTTKKMLDDIAAKPEDTWTDSDAAAFKAGSALLADRYATITGLRAGVARALNIMGAFKDYTPSAQQTQQLRAALERMGGSGQVFKEMAMYKALKDSKGDAAAAQFARKSVLTKSMDVIQEYWINSILSGIPTQMANTIGNSLTAIGRVGETALAATIGAGRQAIGKGSAADRVHFAEVGQQLKGIVQGAQEGLELAKYAFKEGHAKDGSPWGVEVPRDPAITGAGTSEMLTKLGASPEIAQGVGGAIGKFGTVVRTPGRALIATDEMFKSIAYRQNMRSVAARVGVRKGMTGEALDAYVDRVVANPPPALKKLAQEASFYQTFNRDLKHMGGTLGTVSRYAVRARGEQPWLGFVIPFVRTPANVAKHAQERSPFAILDPEFRKEFAAGGDRRDIAAAKVMMGMGVAAIMFKAASDGQVTGGGPTDPHDKQTWRNAGNQPYSIKMGDSWVQYNRLAPWGIILGTAADASELAKAGQLGLDPAQIGSGIVRSLMKNFGEQTMLSGITTVANALTDPNRYDRRLLENLLGPAIPTIFAKGAQALDPSVKDVQDLHDKMLSRIPGLSEKVPSKYTPLGDEITRPNSLATFLYPGGVQVDTQDPVYDELVKLDLNIGFPADSTKLGGKTYALNREDQERIIREAGPRAKDRIGLYMQTPGYQRLPADKQKNLIRNIVDKERDRVRDQVAQDARKRSLLQDAVK